MVIDRNCQYCEEIETKEHHYECQHTINNFHKILDSSKKQLLNELKNPGKNNKPSSVEIILTNLKLTDPNFLSTTLSKGGITENDFKNISNIKEKFNKMDWLTKTIACWTKAFYEKDEDAAKKIYKEKEKNQRHKKN